MNFCKTLAMALPTFYKKTGISVSFVFQHQAKDNELHISLGFLPKEPNEQEYNELFECIIDAEKLLMNEYLLTAATEVENIKQLVFKHKESSRTIIEKNKT